ncbi:DUF2911 domain-containing protein [Nonlabens xiamenensis]|uniref:DUF2911 domain-containing protein n=1 Tax=Nonlabens xiamenensis TaxID=2341043 RepID=UPI000F608BF4|nr:DUF2911 domain-containing protein [Nonlabens xiamenensis]
MNRYLSALAITCLALFSAAQSQNNLNFSALDKSPLDVVMYRDTDRNAIARVIYSRPSKKDRDIFGNLVPYGEIWRTGANEATEIAFYQNVYINDQLVPAGSYSIYTIPGPNSWTFILNKATTQSGLEYDSSQNLLQAEMDIIPSPQEIESFSISFMEQSNGGMIFLGWDDTIASLPFTLEKS